MSARREAREADALRGAATSAIRGSALSLLIGGGICLYFGLTLIADAPASVSEEEAERWWYVVDNAFFWCLRAIGVLFLLTAALAWMGKRVSMLLATIVEAGFALLMIAMTVEWTVEARADGLIDYQVILLLILALVAAGGAKRSWELYAKTCFDRPSVEKDIERL